MRVLKRIYHVVGLRARVTITCLRQITRVYAKYTYLRALSAKREKMDIGFDSYSSDGSELSTSDDSDVRQDSSDDTELEESSNDDDLDVSLDSSSGEDTPYSIQQHTSASPTTDPLDQPLYDGVQMTVWDTYLLLMQHSLRHNLTKRAFSDLLKVVGTLLPRESFTSYYRLRKYFMNEYEDLTLSRHFCCRATFLRPLVKEMNVLANKGNTNFN